MSYAIASNLRGFAASSLRVRVTRRDERSGCVWVTTADLLDAGTPLVLNAAQLAPEEEATLIHHRDGLVYFEEAV